MLNTLCYGEKYYFRLLSAMGGEKHFVTEKVANALYHNKPVVKNRLLLFIAEK
jgi:hypothetical protein